MTSNRDKYRVWSSDDLEEDAQEVEARGVEAAAESAAARAYTEAYFEDADFFVRDPDGVLWCVGVRAEAVVNFHCTSEIAEEENG